jgi:hypothetical protein
MRFRSIAVVTLLSLAAPSLARAQGAAADPQCLGAPIPTRDACQQAVDLFKYMVPQLGVGITGGNFTLGQGGALGGLGHFSIGVRGNLLQGHVPNLQTPNPTTIQQRSAYPVESQFLGLPAVDVSIGVFKGLPLALSNVGGIDLLLSAIYIPDVEADEVSVTPETNLKLGYGVRVGLLQESLVIPGISASYMIRDLPVTDIVGTEAGTGTTLTLDDFDMKTRSWRVTASKSLVLFTLAAGVGQDTYDADASVSAQVGAQNAGPFNFAIPKKLTRTNYFADVALNLMVLKLVGEIGMVSGGDIPTHNTFTTEADASRMYGSVGIRFGF